MSEFFDLFRRNKPVSPKVAELEARLAAAASASDPGERLLACDGVNKDAEKEAVRLYAKEMRLLSGGGMVYGLAMLLVFGVCTPVPLAAASFVALIAASSASLIRMSVVFNSDASARGFIRICERADEMEAAQKKDDLLRFAGSSRFDEVMSRFPDLKEKFILAAARDAAAPPADARRPADAKFHL